ncbi:MAG: hypothetical protein Tsb002_31690 [Wenzhouxiangellaceae bacterium]
MFTRQSFYYPSVLLLTLAAVIGGSFALADSAADPDPTYPASQIREDFAELYQTLEASHYDLFINLARDDYNRAYQQYLEQFDRPLPRSEIIHRFQQFVALGHIAHARIESDGQAYNQYMQDGGRILPLDLRIDRGRVYIADQYSGQPQPAPGSEVLTIEGQPALARIQHMQQQLSADSDYLAHTMLEFQFQRLLWRDYGPRDAYTLTVRDNSGAVQTVQIPTLTPETARRNAAASPLLALSWSAREYRMLTETTGYLRPGPFYNTEGDDLWDQRDFVKWIDQAFNHFINADAKQLIVDLRNNPGGDNSFSDPMIAWFADRRFRFYKHFWVKVSEAAIAANQQRLAANSLNDVSQRYAREYAQRQPGDIIEFEFPYTQPRQDRCYQGAVYALVNRHSYSNTVTVAAILQDYGFATIIGEETADLATTLGAMEHFELTHTGIKVGFPKAQIIRPNGDLTRRGVQPD